MPAPDWPPVLSGMPLEELAEALSPFPRFRAAQILKWIASGAASFDEMTDLPLAMRAELSARFLPRPRVGATSLRGDDGAEKLVMTLADGARVEAVLLEDARPRDRAENGRAGGRDSARYTACLSTQVGCPAGCAFCATGAMGFTRDLRSAEIVEQFLLLTERAKTGAAREDSPPGRAPEGHPVSNVVVMGMGEPLLNLAELRRAVAVMGDRRGMNFSSRRITVSTCGVAEGIASLADEGPAARLALSLTTADEGLRRRLMPFTARGPLREVKEALLYFQEKGGGRVTLEAALLGGLNARDRDAREMAAFASGLDVGVNLIPWNPVKGLDFEGAPLREPSAAEVEAFAKKLTALGLNVTRRFRRGRGVAGACGQLGGA